MCINPGFWSGFFCGMLAMYLLYNFGQLILFVCHNAVQGPFLIGGNGFDERFFFVVSALQRKHCSYISFMVAGAVDCTLATGPRSKFPGPIYFTAP